MTDTVLSFACPRCSIGTPIFGGSCIVCNNLNEPTAKLLKELVEKKAAVEEERDALRLNLRMARDNFMAATEILRAENREMREALAKVAP